MTTRTPFNVIQRIFSFPAYPNFSFTPSSKTLVGSSCLCKRIGVRLCLRPVVQYKGVCLDSAGSTWRCLWAEIPARSLQALRWPMYLLSFLFVSIYSISPHLHLRPRGKWRVLHHCDTVGGLPLLRAPPAGVDGGLAGFYSLL